MQKFTSVLIQAVRAEPAIHFLITFHSHALFPLHCHLCVLASNTTPGRYYTAGVKDVQTEQRRPAGSLHCSHLHVMYHPAALSGGPY